MKWSISVLQLLFGNILRSLNNWSKDLRKIEEIKIKSLIRVISCLYSLNTVKHTLFIYLTRVVLLYEKTLSFLFSFQFDLSSLYYHPLFILTHPPPIFPTPYFLPPSVSPYIVPSRGMFVRVAFFCGRALPISTPRDCAAIGVTPHGTYIHVAHAALRTFIARRRCCRRLLHTMNSLSFSLPLKHQKRPPSTNYLQNLQRELICYWRWSRRGWFCMRK